MKEGEVGTIDQIDIALPQRDMLEAVLDEWNAIAWSKFVGMGWLDEPLAIIQNGKISKIDDSGPFQITGYRFPVKVSWSFLETVLEYSW